MTADSPHGGGQLTARSIRADARRSLPTIAVIFLPAGLLIAAPWTLFVLSLGEALDRGWPGPWNSDADVFFGEESVSGMTISVLFAGGILIVAGVVAGILARRRGERPVLVALIGTLGVLLIAGLCGLLALI
jgi:MFS family permease